jgi:dihydroorotate dehydrogenase (NAD+) catalytic subunit
METRLGALRLANPIIGAAGAFGLTAVVPGAAQGDPLGAVVTASVSYRGHPGAPPRLVEAAAGAIFAPAGERTGIRRALGRCARLWATSPGPVVVSIVGESPGEVGAAAAELEGVRGVAAMELLIDDPDLIAETVRAARRACALPVWVKLHPDLPNLAVTLGAAASAGAAAATIGGGLHAAGPSGDGYLVGPATFPVVLASVQQIAPVAPLPLIVGGGIVSAEQARGYLRAGATAVQVGSAQLANPLAAMQIRAAFGALRASA